MGKHACEVGGETHTLEEISAQSNVEGLVTCDFLDVFMSHSELELVYMPVLFLSIYPLYTCVR